MKHEVSYQVQGERGAVVERICAYMDCAGYRCIQEGEELVFRRGSLVGSAVGFAPVQWLATVRARVAQTPNRAMKASFVYDINTLLQHVTAREAAFWNIEVDGLECAVKAMADCPAREAAREAALELKLAAREVEMNNWRAVARLILAPIVFIPFIVAFIIGIDPLTGFAADLAENMGALPVIGAAVGVLLLSLAAGMFWLPAGRPHTFITPAGMLIGAAGRSAYFGAFALLVFSSLFVLAAVEDRVWVMLLVALAGLGTAASMDKLKHR